MHLCLRSKELPGLVITTSDVRSRYLLTEVFFGSQYTGGGDHWYYQFDLQFAGPNLTAPSGFEADEFLRMLRADECQHVQFPGLKL
jgi:hypothetical protein